VTGVTNYATQLELTKALLARCFWGTSYHVHLRICITWGFT